MANPEELQKLQSTIARDVSGSFATAIAYIGDQLGLFKALAKQTEPTTPTSLAQEFGLNTRYVLEWCRAAASAEYIESHDEGTLFFMTAAQKQVLAEEEGPSFLSGYFGFAIGNLLQVDGVMQQGFREGYGVPYSQYGPIMSQSIDRMHTPVFKHTLATTIQNIPECRPLLKSSQCRLLDVGCGCGTSSLYLAKAFPNIQIVGVDPDEYSIQQAVSKAQGIENLSFETCGIEKLAEQKQAYDIVLCFDCIHDMHDPPGALKTVHNLLKDDSSVFIWSEPAGFVDPMKNRNVKGRTRACISPLHCMTVSLASGGAGLGTIIGQQGAEQLAKDAGFSSIKLCDQDNKSQFFFKLKR